VFGYKVFLSCSCWCRLCGMANGCTWYHRGMIFRFAPLYCYIQY
jgi:hypothetical protein